MRTYNSDIVYDLIKFCDKGVTGIALNTALHKDIDKDVFIQCYMLCYWSEPTNTIKPLYFIAAHSFRNLRELQVGLNMISTVTRIQPIIFQQTHWNCSIIVMS